MDLNGNESIRPVDVGTENVAPDKLGIACGVVKPFGAYMMRFVKKEVMTARSLGTKLWFLAM